MPRAAEMPTRSPVKLPGPAVTAIRSSWWKARPARPITRATSGIRASACPRAIPRVSLARTLPPSVSNTAAAQAASAVSMARISIADNASTQDEDGRRRSASSAASLPAAGSDRAHLGHVWHEMAQQVLDAMAQCRRRRWAAGACALHVEIDHAVLEAAERDVAAVVGHRRAHARLDQFLDGGDVLGVGRLEKLLSLGGHRAGIAQERLAGHEVLHDGAEDRRLELLPLAVAFAHGDEVVAEEHAADALDAEQALGQWRAAGFVEVAHVEGARSQDRAPGQEFQRRRIGRGLGLDEHGSAPQDAARQAASRHLYMVPRHGRVNPEIPVERAAAAITTWRPVLRPSDGRARWRRESDRRRPSWRGRRPAGPALPCRCRRPAPGWRCPRPLRSARGSLRPRRLRGSPAPASGRRRRWRGWRTCRARHSPPRALPPS